MDIKFIFVSRTIHFKIRTHCFNIHVHRVNFYANGSSNKYVKVTIDRVKFLYFHIIIGFACYARVKLDFKYPQIKIPSNFDDAIVD